ncbi:MAG: DUF86 domain-containing protein [Chloroflexi bacterium]|uniref:HepT-like ribonuclease domain-containing protein n=1 Tax=Candidatus Flexifilum breve TaxID=3140694 RepID=UPI003134D0A0|nr:DUF86 domain-containing protein [Chloroflexota bacterium]
MKDDKVYLRDIADCIEKIQRYTQAGLAAFEQNPMAQDAVIRNFEIIGEATKRLSNELKSQNSEIPWRRIAGFRDVLIHDYTDIDLTEVWNTVERDLPLLQRKVEALIAALTDEN